MKIVNNIPEFDMHSNDSIERFEDALLTWVDKYGKNGVMLFDFESLKQISVKIIEEYSKKGKNYGWKIYSPEEHYFMNTPNLTINFFELPGTQCCILKSIQNREGSILTTIYKMPSKWEDSKLYYCY